MSSGSTWPSASRRGRSRLAPDGAEDGGNEGGFHVVFGHSSGLGLGAGGVDERDEHREMPGGRDLGAEAAVALAALDQRFERGEDGFVLGVKLGMGELRVDGDQGVVAAQRPPSRLNDAAQRLRRGRRGPARRRR